jgi:hypothetical protein
MSQQVENQVFTKLVDKHASPLILRKYTRWGFPIYVSVISDNDLTTFDDVVVAFIEANKAEGWVNNIQTLRNLSGALTEHLLEKYDRTEGAAVIFYVDKMFISSLYGDYMNHFSTKYELLTLIDISTQI